ncbi:MAG: Lrp/AsnC ligand binding domain-containing protein [Candidatus Thermoplasmatota archaeon]|nr:Lrp/AsnC ligand binding domain-containing protein [Candidatus Thermoplasmatota archaeon]MDD5777976.1 Lrp/AsnC ligand binding domain-containing protein [Candidatus Thermoplasmatota archaeon]
MIKAYIMILVYVGKLAEVLNKLRTIENIESIAVTAGDYDLIVKVSVDSLEALMEVTDQIQMVGNIKRTTTTVIEKEISV